MFDNDRILLFGREKLKRKRTICEENSRSWERIHMVSFESGSYSIAGSEMSITVAVTVLS